MNGPSVTLAVLWFTALGTSCTKVLDAPPPPPPSPAAAEQPSAAAKSPRPARAARWGWPEEEPRAAPTTGTPDAARVATPETLNGDPKGLKREDLNEALQAALPALASCFQTAGPATGPPVVGLTFDAASGGRAQNVKVTGASKDAERCVSNAVAALKLPSFEGKSVPVQFPLSVYREPPPPPSQPAPAPPAGQTAPGSAAVPPSSAAASAGRSSTVPYVPGGGAGQAPAGAAPSGGIFVKP